MNPPDPRTRRRSRIKLLLVAAIFAAPFVAALILSATGWQPGVRGNGEPVLPQRNLEQEHLRVPLANGDRWAWRDTQPRLTLVALPGPDCAQRCFAALTAAAKSRIMLNRNQSRLRLLYLGEPPADHGQRQAMAQYWTIGRDLDGTLAAYRPATPDSVSMLLVESNGTVLSLYRDGFEATGLARDLQKVVR